ncbi:MAG: hypothetical protein AAF914_09940 [Pseudomonadota bacterium]
MRELCGFQGWMVSDAFDTALAPPIGGTALTGFVHSIVANSVQHDWG